MSPPAPPEPREKLPIGEVYAGIVRGYLRDWRVLLTAGFVIFLPVGLIEAAAPPELDVDKIDGGVLMILLAAIPLEIVLHVLGTVIYTGVVAAGERQARSHQRESLIEMVRDLPLGTLILADVALVLVLIGGFIALVVPAIVFAIWFALLAPVIEIERLGVRAAFARSRALIHAQFWRCAAIVLPVTVLQAGAEQLGHDLGVAILGHNFAGDAVAAVFANVLGGSLIALTAVVLYFELVDRHEEPATPAAAGA
jgi:hypothetical protein